MTEMASDPLDRFRLFDTPLGGPGQWVASDSPPLITDRLREIDKRPISRTELNQLLMLTHQADMSSGCFEHYFLSEPSSPNYRLAELDVPDSVSNVSHGGSITSFEQLYWGIYRLHVDALLYFGNVRTAYRELRIMTGDEIVDRLAERRFDSEAMSGRGPILPLEEIARDDRYLIAEQACKTLDPQDTTAPDFEKHLVERWQAHKATGGAAVSFKTLLQSDLDGIDALPEMTQPFLYVSDDFLHEKIESKTDIENQLRKLLTDFNKVRAAAGKNTQLFLSMVNELDVYVATSMGTRQNYRDVAQTCSDVFKDPRLREFRTRYFDPTLSAADGHVDKGLIECLMVKCAKALLYCAGDGASYGKDAEAAMALSLGKPVIFLCTQDAKRRFYRDVHPLSRLIEFRTGVAVGALVALTTDEVAELLHRTFSNSMAYRLRQDPKKSGALQLVDDFTESIVRVQSANKLLAETFWNTYHNVPHSA